MFKKAWETYEVVYEEEYGYAFIVGLICLAVGVLSALNSYWGWFLLTVAVLILAACAVAARCAMILLQLKCPEGAERLQEMVAHQERRL